MKSLLVDTPVQHAACQTFHTFEANDIRNSKFECLDCHSECHIKLKKKILE